MKLDYLNDHFLPFIALILAYYASISSYFFFASSNFSCSSNLILAASSLFRFTSSNFSLFLYFSSSVKIDFGFSFYSTGFSLFSNRSSESEIMLIVYKKGIIKNEKLYICEIWMNIKKFIIKLIPID
jgi:hypothetical protein